MISQEKGKHLFILSGQSNMSRFNPKESFLPILEKQFGAENIILVKEAKGGQPIKEWYKKWQPKSNDYAGNNGLIYDKMINKINKSIKNTKLKSISFIWMQGEADSKHNYGNVYKQSLRGLFNQLKQDLNRDDINFIIGRLSDFGINHKKRKDWNFIRNIQMQLATELKNTVWINCDDLNDGLDKKGRNIKNGLHYSVEGYKILGERYANACIKLIAK